MQKSYRAPNPGDKRPWFLIDAKDQPLGRIPSMVCAVLLVVTVIGRLLSGVHWLTDILGGLLLGGALYLFYAGLIDLLRQRGRI